MSGFDLRRDAGRVAIFGTGPYAVLSSLGSSLARIVDRNSITPIVFLPCWRMGSKAD